MDNRNHNAILVQALQSLGGLAALTLGLLYLTGLGIKTRELERAGLSVRDVLPLFPLEQILRTSLVVVWPSLLVLCFLGLLLVLSRTFERWVSDQCMDVINQELVDHPNDPELLRVAEEARRRADWKPVMKRLAQEAKEARSAQNHDRAKSIGRARRALRAWSVAGTLFVVIVGPAAYLFLPPGIALPCLALWWFGLILSPKMGPRPAEQELAVLYVIFLVGLLASTVFYPPPLAQVSVQPANISGRLIVVSDSTWYLATTTGRIEAIPSSTITSAEVTPQPEESTVLQRLVH